MSIIDNSCGKTCTCDSSTGCMKNKSMSKDTQLPAEWLDKIDKEAELFANKECGIKGHINSSQLLRWELTQENWKAGATEYATIAYKAQQILNEVLVMNEMWGDLPGEFITKVKNFLDGTQ